MSVRDTVRREVHEETGVHHRVHTRGPPRGVSRRSLAEGERRVMRRIHHVGIVVNRLADAYGFYRDTLGLPLVKEAVTGRPGPFALQAAIAAQHCQAARAEDTDWPQIVRLYDLLERVQPSPIVSLNRAVAVAMADGPQSGLALMDVLAAAGDLQSYHLLHAARADLLRRVGSKVEAAKSYEQALALVTNESERRFLERRLREVQPPEGSDAV